MSSDEADTYKCFAKNEYGKAVVTATLNVIEGQSPNFAQTSLLPHDVPLIHMFYHFPLHFILVGYKKNKALQQSRTGTFCV